VIGTPVSAGAIFIFFAGESSVSMIYLFLLTSTWPIQVRMRGSMTTCHEVRFRPIFFTKNKTAHINPSKSLRVTKRYYSDINFIK
jgi:hypothetical protein